MKKLLIKSEILKKFLFSSLMLLSGTAMADTVSPEQALGKATRFFQQSVNTRGQAQSLTLAHTAQADDETYFYVFNNPAGGYVIVGGDDVAHDVLAYSESGSFDYDQLSPATRWWLGQYQNQIHSAIVAEHQGMAAQNEATRALPLNRTEIKPLLGGIAWNQTAPYNADILGSAQIEDPQLQYATGCVATATAQVMRYWKYPERGRFSHAYRWKDQLLEANFAESVYEWDLMQEKYEATYSGTPEENAVAKLMSDVCIAFNMNYGRKYTPGSAAPDRTIPYALATYFGYDKNMELLERDSLTNLPAGGWEEMIYNELAEKRPVIYGGGGHSFICDGYKDGFFHINWGWGGMANDEYYLLTSTEATPALAPKDEGVGGNGLGQYSGDESIIIGIQPDPQSEGFVYLTEPMNVPAEAPYGPQHYEGKLYNPTSQDVKATVGIVFLPDISLKEDVVFQHDTAMVFPAGQETLFSFDVPESAFIPGVTYYINFSIIDESDPEIPIEKHVAKSPLMFSSEVTHIEGPEYVLLDLSRGLTTICAPFDAELPQGVVAYTAERITADNQVIMKLAFSIEAGKCYLLGSVPTAQPVLLSGMKTTEEVWSVGPVFTGNMSSAYQYYDGPSYGVTLIDGIPLLIRNTRPSGVPAYKILVDGSLSDAYYLYFNYDEATGIELVDDRSSGSSLRYNLMGHPSKGKGFVIRNGRVVFEK